ncbi:MAG: hypothetical protein JWM21_4692 [Acidobacteria bacterium]|nr:hypothetical protein [Acidobacteriota bacterium]
MTKNIAIGALALILAMSPIPSVASFQSPTLPSIFQSQSVSLFPPLSIGEGIAPMLDNSYLRSNYQRPNYFRGSNYSLGSNSHSRDFFPGATATSANLKPSAFTTTITVTSLADSGAGSFRTALMTANASMSLVEIDFTVAGRISLQSILPSISRPVFINGATAPGYLGSPLVALDGTCALNPFGAKNGLFFESGAGGSIVRGLAFHDFEGNGCTTSAGGPGIMGSQASNVLVSECGFGQTRDFLEAGSGSNNAGILPGPGWTIANCVITGNSHGGIVIQNNMNGVKVLGSLIGVDVYNLGLGNGLYGISANASNITIANCIISGSANGVYGPNIGPALSLSGANIVISSNFIGTDIGGAGARPNSEGIVLGNSTHVSILNNLISGNQGNGIHIGNGNNDISILGNFIGTNFGGTFALPNLANGIKSDGGAVGLKIGGTSFGAGNVISGNKASGINLISTNAAVVQGNYIGTDVRGNRLSPCDFRLICDPASLSITSNVLDGITIDGGSTNTVGVANPLLMNQNGVTIGSSLGSNLIAFNGRNGITTLNQPESILVNQFIGNGQLAIDNSNDGVTPNHPCSGGPPNYPQVSSANTQNGVTTVTGTLSSSQSSQYTINFFYSASCDPSGFGEGSFFIGSAGVQTDNNCSASFSFAIPTLFAKTVNSPLPAGGFLTTTAIDSGGNTSEFSQCRLITADNAAADLLTTQSFTPGRVLAGSPIAFNIQVKNNGPDAAVGVILRDTLPAGASFVSCNAGGGGICGGAGNDRTVSFSSLASGAAAQVTITAMVDNSSVGGTVLNNLVAASSSTPDANPLNNVSSLSPVVSPPGPLPIIEFETDRTLSGEGMGTAKVWVIRTGDLSGSSTVDFATSDGTASQRTRYTPAAGTLTFASGESRKSFGVQLTDGAYVEGSKTVNLVLSNATSATLGTLNTSTLTISDNDSIAPTTNPLDDSDALFFVRQHYNDFLNRAPDLGGFDYWANQISQCGTDAACIRAKKTDVSNAFYFELEFQQTGSYVFRLYRASYGNDQPFPNNHPDPMFPNEEKKLPNYTVFVADRSRVIGGANLAQRQLDLANAFVLRPEFQTKYPLSLATADQFVDAVLLTLSNDLGISLSAERASLINLYNGQGGRGAVMYRLADDSATNPINNRALIDEEYNRTFVATQYFGYLRRNPDIAGFLFWLGQMNGASLRDVAKQHAMVCSFITSAEYQQRFSPVVTHSNADCQ